MSLSWFVVKELFSSKHEEQSCAVRPEWLGSNQVQWGPKGLVPDHWWVSPKDNCKGTDMFDQAMGVIPPDLWCCFWEATKLANVSPAPLLI